MSGLATVPLNDAKAVFNAKSFFDFRVDEQRLQRFGLAGATVSRRSLDSGIRRSAAFLLLAIGLSQIRKIFPSPQIH